MLSNFSRSLLAFADLHSLSSSTFIVFCSSFSLSCSSSAPLFPSFLLSFPALHPLSCSTSSVFLSLFSLFCSYSARFCLSFLLFSFSMGHFQPFLLYIPFSRSTSSVFCSSFSLFCSFSAPLPPFLLAIQLLGVTFSLSCPSSPFLLYIQRFLYIQSLLILFCSFPPFLLAIQLLWVTFSLPALHLDSPASTSSAHQNLFLLTISLVLLSCSRPSSYSILLYCSSIISGPCIVHTRLFIFPSFFLVFYATSWIFCLKKWTGMWSYHEYFLDFVQGSWGTDLSY